MREVGVRIGRLGRADLTICPPALRRFAFQGSIAPRSYQFRIALHSPDEFAVGVGACVSIKLRVCVKRLRLQDIWNRSILP